MVDKANGFWSVGRLVLCLGLLSLMGGWVGCTAVFGPHGIEELGDLEAVPAWFQQHKAELEVVMRLLQPHEAISRVYRLEPILIPQNIEISRADEAAYVAAVAIIRKLGVPLVTVRRIEGESPRFKFVLRRVGIVGSGSSTSIVHSKGKSSALANLESSPRDLVLYLGEPFWYARKSSRNKLDKNNDGTRVNTD